MKIIKSEFRENKKHGGANIHTVELGTKELELLLALVLSARKYTPRTLETIPTIGRLRDIKKNISEHLRKCKDMLYSNGIKKLS